VETFLPIALAYSLAAGWPLISRTRRSFAIAFVTTRRFSLPVKCWVLNASNLKGVVATSRSAALVMKEPLANI